jgi:hypothetical protein
MSRKASKFLIADFKFRMVTAFGSGNQKSETGHLEVGISAKRREAA